MYKRQYFFGGILGSDTKRSVRRHASDNNGGSYTTTTVYRCCLWPMHLVQCTHGAEFSLFLFIWNPLGNR